MRDTLTLPSLLSLLITGAENPTYLKEPGDKLFVTLGFAGMTVGLVCVLRGLYSMSFGVNKIQK